MDQQLEKKLTSADFSEVWKDGNDIQQSSGLKLDLVKHLQKQRESPGWVKLKEKLIESMKIETYDLSYEIQFLDVGCGLGIDLLLIANAVIESKHKIRIVGLDFNSQMIEHAQKLVSEHQLPSNIRIELVKGDVTALAFQDKEFDIVRSDITIQHVNKELALTQICRVLKQGGLYISLEAGFGDVYTSDEFIMKINHKVLPQEVPTAIQMYLMMPKIGFERISHHFESFPTYGKDYIDQDPLWVKLKGMGELLVQKGILTKEESDEYQRRYVQACENNQIIGLGASVITQCFKK